MIDAVNLSGNKVTRDQVIYREIIFSPGDTIPAASLDSLISRSRENLLNTSLFNFVDTEKAFQGPDSVNVSVGFRFTERWYIWPIPILKLSDRNFNVWWETKDFSRLSYGFYVDWHNFRGRKENLIFRLQFGYDRLYDLQYIIPYLNKKKTLGMGFGAGVWKQRETAYKTEDDRQQFYRDADTYARQDIFAFGQFLVRRGIYNSHLFEIRYDHHHFSDSLIAQNHNYTVKGENDLQYFSFMYFFKSDHRDFRQYPLKGYYFDIEALKNGFGLGESSINTFQLMATFRKYWELGPDLYFASGLNGKISAGDPQPYYILRGIGYDRDIVRSYEYYVVDALHFAILKNNLKYALIPMRVDEIRFIRSEKFRKIYYALYMNMFVDIGYSCYNQDFGTETNDLQNSWLVGYGAGLDFVTYYDIVIRLEFSINRMSEPGVFLHFRAPI